MPRGQSPTSSTEAKISPLSFNSVRFSAADPFMTDQVQIWRMTQTSVDEGEPKSERLLVSTVAARIDDLKSRHTDSSFRTAITNVQQNYGLIFLGPKTDVKVNDVLRSVSLNQDYQIIELNYVQGAFGLHHIEVFSDKVQGAV